MPRAVLLMSSSMRGGGSERQTLLLLRHLDRARFAPQLYLTERAGDLLEQIPPDVPVHSYDQAAPARGLYYPGRALAQQSRFLGQLLARESIAVIYDRTFHMTLVAAGPAKALAVPRVSTIVSPPDQALPLVEQRFVELKRRRLAQAYSCQPCGCRGQRGRRPCRRALLRSPPRPRRRDRQSGRRRAAASGGQSRPASTRSADDPRLCWPDDP